MRIALLSAGPSLPRALPRQYDVRIGVNRAAKFFEVDWWCAGDWQTIELLQAGIKGRPNICSIEDSLHWCEANAPHLLTGKQQHGWRNLIAAHNPPTGSDTWSATMALVLAHHLGAKHIDCYGVDMAGPVDCGGQGCTGRNEVRWERERKDWAETVRWMNDHGTSIELVGCGASCDGSWSDLARDPHADVSGGPVVRTIHMIKPRMFGDTYFPAGTPIAQVTLLHGDIRPHNMVEALRNNLADFVQEETPKQETDDAASH